MEEHPDIHQGSIGFGAAGRHVEFGGWQTHQCRDGDNASATATGDGPADQV